MKQYAVLGRRLPYTLSPLIYNTAFDHLKLPARYSVLEVEPENFRERMSEIKAGQRYAGFNITIPYKTAILPLLDELDPAAAKTGAVNTVVNDHGRWKGCNTDAAGFMKPLREWPQPIREAVVLGAGGAARAVICGLSELYQPVIHLVVRDRVKGAELKTQFPGSRISVHPFSESAGLLQTCDLMVNTTPLGTWPAVDETPLADLSALKAGCILYDLVYNPPVTRLQQDALALGKTITVIGGLEMLLGQAAEAFRLWTGRDLPAAAVREAIRDEG